MSLFGGLFSGSVASKSQDNAGANSSSLFNSASAFKADDASLPNQQAATAAVHAPSKKQQVKEEKKAKKGSVAESAAQPPAASSGKGQGHAPKQDDTNAGGKRKRAAEAAAAPMDKPKATQPNKIKDKETHGAGKDAAKVELPAKKQKSNDATAVGAPADSKGNNNAAKAAKKAAALQAELDSKHLATEKPAGAEGKKKGTDSGKPLANSVAAPKANGDAQKGSKKQKPGKQEEKKQQQSMKEEATKASEPEEESEEAAAQDSGLDSQREEPASQGEAGSRDEADGDAEGAAASEDAKEKVKLTPEQEADKLRCTVFVGNLPAAIKPKALKRLFATYGAVESVRLRSLPVKLDAKMPKTLAIKAGKVDAARSPAQGYVVFKSEEAVAGALGANMAEVEGHHIRVDRATAPRSKKDAAAGDGASVGGASATVYEPTRSLFIGNLHFQVTDEEVIQFIYSEAEAAGLADVKGQVEAVRVVRDKATNIGKGFAFVLLRSKAAARAALALNGKSLKGRPLRVTNASQRLSGQAAKGAKPSGSMAFKGSKGGKPGAGAPGQRQVGGKPGKPGFGGPGKKPSKKSMDPADWQGTRTKGKGKAERGIKKLDTRGGRVGSASGGVAGGKKRGAVPARSGGKRPAVAARKAKQQGAAPPGLKVKKTIDKGARKGKPGRK